MESGWEVEKKSTRSHPASEEYPEGLWPEFHWFKKRAGCAPHRTLVDMSHHPEDGNRITVFFFWFYDYFLALYPF